MKYTLNLTNDGVFELYTIEEEELVCKGKLEDLGIKENDPNYTNVLDDYFEKEYNIKPSEWEIG